MKNRVFEFLDVLAESAPNNLRVGAWGSSSGQCRESDMSQSSSNLETQQGMVLHLYVSISESNHIVISVYSFQDIDECTDGTDMCDSLAVCSDTEGSYNCSCSSGYTGSGFTCNGNHKRNTINVYWCFSCRYR